MGNGTFRALPQDDIEPLVGMVLMLSSVLCVCVLVVILEPIRVPQREDQVGELAPLKPCDELLVLVMAKLARVVFEDGLGRLARRGVKQHNRGDIIAIRLGDACDLLGQDPHANPVVPRGEPEIDQLARAALHILGRGAVVQHEQRVGPREEVAGHPKLGLDLVLEAAYDPDVRVAVHEAFVCLVLNEGGAEEDNIIKLAPKRPAQLVEKILRLARVSGPHD